MEWQSKDRQVASRVGRWPVGSLVPGAMQWEGLLLWDRPLDLHTSRVVWDLRGASENWGPGQVVRFLPHPVWLQKS